MSHTNQAGAEKPMARTKDIAIQELNNETLAYDLRTNKAYCLNDTAASVWKQCNGQRTVAEIAGVLSEELNQPIPVELVWITLDKLSKDDLLVTSITKPKAAINESRRQVMQKIGISAVLALPVILSMSAPTAAQSGSPRAYGAPCNSGGDCASGMCSGGVCA